MPRDTLPATAAGVFGVVWLVVTIGIAISEFRSAREWGLLTSAAHLFFVLVGVGIVFAAVYRATYREAVRIDSSTIEVEQEALGRCRVQSVVLKEVDSLAVDIDRAAGPLRVWQGLIELSSGERKIRFGGALSEQQAHLLVDEIRGLP